MGWLDKVKKWKPGRAIEKRVEKAFKPSKWHQKFVTRPSAWRSWKPFRDKGGGLGKLLTGAMQVVTPTDDPMYEMLEHMGRGQSLTDMGKRWSKEHMETVGEWEQFQESGAHQDFLSTVGANPEDLTNRELFQILGSGDQNAIRSMLSVLGYGDVGGQLSQYVGNQLWDIQSKYKELYAEKMKPVEGAWSKFGGEFENLKRTDNMWGDPIDDKAVGDFAESLDLKYGNIDKEVLSTVINEALNAISGYSTEVS